jgi:trans-AT polyketide synthase/acyltransferase/oxidoreductase domain-containing protein
MSTLMKIGSLALSPADIADDPSQFLAVVNAPRTPLWVVRNGDTGALAVAAVTGQALGVKTAGSLEALGCLPGIYPEWLGDRSFCETHGVRFPYVVGAMANGITSVQMVVAAARARLLAFFGAGGLSYPDVADAIGRIEGELAAGLPYGANLIHSPHEPALENAVAELYLQRNVRFVSASAYMKLTPAIVRLGVGGLQLAPDGSIIRHTQIFAKVSRPEVAEQFMSPAPAAIVKQLVAAGQISAQQAQLAERVPLAEDITAEADSGGHTDNRPLTALLPSLGRLRDAIAARHGFFRPIRIGAAGGLGDPAALAAAFAQGAAYVVTGSVNQSTVEAGTSQRSRELLAAADLADVMMAPSPDMFELGVKVQVLKRGTLFAQRAAKLYEIYRSYESLEALPAETRQQLETEIFQAPLDQIWQETARFFAERNAGEVQRAERDARHRMALVFRWYVGKSSRWAIAGDNQRELDYQIWCGPAMGAFNRWVRGSFLEDVENRSVTQVALNLLEGAAVVTRAHQLRSYGLPVAASAFDFRPRPLC